MKMGLYKLFSYNVEVQYKSYFLSKAMFFTLTTNALIIIIPFIIANRSRGFWLNSIHFYEKPIVRPTFDYLLLAETNDPSVSFLCGDANIVNNENPINDEYCQEVQIQEYSDKDRKSHRINIKLQLNIPSKHTIASIVLIIGLDFYLTTVCPLQMQSLAVINREFAVPSHELKFYGHLRFYQATHLPCLRHHIDTSNNMSLFKSYVKERNENAIDSILETYLTREVTTQVQPMFVRNQIGQTGTLNIDFHLQIPEMKILYSPSLLQELKWAWPQYLSLVFVFYWIFSKIKRFVFNNRLLMAWEITPWKKNRQD